MLENIFPIDDLRTLARSRSKSVQTKSVHPKLVDEAAAEGWTVASAGKASVRLQRKKTLSIEFEDRVWSMLFRMRFDYLSGFGGGKLALNLDNTDGPKNQLDVVAIDSELILGVECKTSENIQKDLSFRRNSQN